MSRVREIEITVVVRTDLPGERFRGPLARDIVRTARANLNNPAAVRSRGYPFQRGLKTEVLAIEIRARKQATKATPGRAGKDRGEGGGGARWPRTKSGSENSNRA